MVPKEYLIAEKYAQGGVGRGLKKQVVMFFVLVGHLVVVAITGIT